jgi:hypothetical protein
MVGGVVSFTVVGRGVVVRGVVVTGVFVVCVPPPPPPPVLFLVVVFGVSVVLVPRLVSGVVLVLVFVVTFISRTSVS